MQEVKVILPSELKHGGKFKGRFDIEVLDEQGNLISKSSADNVLTAEGLNSILNVYLHGATQITTWYCIIFETDTTPSDATTYAVPVFTEWTAYDEATRPEYVEAASVAKSVTNSANKATFTASDTKTLYGAAIVGGGSDPTVKGNVLGGGTMPCAGKFGAQQPVVDNNVINLTYTITAADAG